MLQDRNLRPEMSRFVTSKLREYVRRYRSYAAAADDDDEEQ